MNRLAGAVAVALFCSAAACTGSDAAETPDDFTRLSTEGFSVAYPEDWDVVEESDDRVEAEATDYTGVQPRTSVEREQSSVDDLDGYVDFLAEEADVISQRDEESREAVDVAGAADARLLASTYDAEDDAGEPDVVRQLDLVAVTDDTVVYLSARASDESFDHDTLQAIADSLWVGEEADA